MPSVTYEDIFRALSNAVEGPPKMEMSPKEEFLWRLLMELRGGRITSTEIDEVVRFHQGSFIRPSAFCRW